MNQETRDRIATYCKTILIFMRHMEGGTVGNPEMEASLEAANDVSMKLIAALIMANKILHIGGRERHNLTIGEDGEFLLAVYANDEWHKIETEGKDIEAIIEELEELACE